ncbi:MAG: PilN domain-containing protein [Thermodesulfovibrionales bacterium]|nr:PilN domain-containing protein [Thermodesulfovibrionales bacterium]
MIKINLIGEEKRKRKKKPLQIKNVTFLFLVIMGLTILINGGAFLYLYLTVSSLEEKKKANDTVLSDLNKKIAEVKRLEELNQEINKRKGIIQKLTKNKSVPVRILNEVNSTLPEGIWLNKIEYKGNNVNIEGTALTNIAVVSFIENLKNSKLANNVFLQESNQVEFEKVPVYRFKLTFEVNV